jgi:hypothetical protein
LRAKAAFAVSWSSFEKLAEHACAAYMVFGHRAFAGVGRRIVIVREIYNNDNIIIIGCHVNLS